MSETGENTFKAIESQEELDRIIKERLSRERETTLKERLSRERETTQKRYEGWVSPEDHAKAIAEANKSFDDYKKAHEGDEQTIADLTAKNKAYETASLKSRIAHEVGLSYEWISRIGGDDEKSIRADAESLKKLVGNGQTVVLPTKNTEANENTKDSTYKQVLNSIQKN